MDVRDGQYRVAEHGITKFYSTNINIVMKFRGIGSHDRDYNLASEKRVIAEHEAKKLLGIYKYIVEDNINMHLRKRLYEGLD
jgi:hypothetical protein